MNAKQLSNAAATLGRKGGQSSSEAKAAAARENGRKGGRPVYRYIRHNQSGDIVFARIIGDRVDQASAALHYSEVTQDNLDHLNFDTTAEDGDWWSVQDWRIVEPSEYYVAD